MGDAVSFLDAEIPAEKPSMSCHLLLKQICFCFSDQLVSPGKRDRSERSVNMRLYHLTPAHLLVMFAALTASALITLFIDTAAPSVFNTESLSATTLPSSGHSVNLSSGPFIIRSPFLTSFSQQLQLNAIFRTAAEPGEIFEQQFFVTVDIEGARGNEDRVKLFDQQRFYNRSRRLHCHGDKCSPVSILSLHHLKFNNYILLLNTKGLEDVDERYTIKEITFELSSISAEFSYMQLWSRTLFLASTASSAIWFLYTLRKSPLHEWSMEQKWTLVLLFFLALYNNPLYPACLLSGHELTWSLDHVMKVTFICSLLLYWLCLLHGIRQTIRSWLKFYVPKLLVVGSLWLLMVVLVSWHDFKQHQHPTYDWKSHSSLQTLETCILLVFFVYSIYITILLVRGYAELRTLPILGRRLRFAAALTLLLMVWAVLLLIRSGRILSALVTGPAALITASDTFLNTCLMAMTWTYSSTDYHTEREYGYVRPSGMMTMTADSDDEDVLYDEGDTRLPLHRTSNQEDSD